MKISYITMQFPLPSETFASNDIMTLKNMGFDINVYALKNRHKNYEKIVNDRGLSQLSIFSCGTRESLIGVIEILKSFLLFSQLLVWIIRNDFKRFQHLVKCIVLIPNAFFILKQLKKQNPNVVHLFWGHYPSIVGFLVKKTMPQTKLSIFLGAYDLGYSLGISRCIAKEADSIFTHAYANIKTIAKMDISETSINVIHRGVSINTIDNKNLDFASKINDSFISVGRLLKTKGFEDVINVFDLYAKSFRFAKLTIIGDGEYKAYLVKKTKDMFLAQNINFTGMLKHDHVLNKLLTCDIFLMLSYKEGERLPNVVKEAMFCGCICVVSSTPGMEELITNGVDGFIVDKEEYDNIPNLLHSLSDEHKDKIRRNAVKKIINNFDIKISMQKYVEVWSKNAKV